MIANSIVLLFGLAPPVIELSAALAKSTGGGASAGAISAGEYTPPPPRFMMSSRPDLACTGLPLVSELTSARRFGFARNRTCIEACALGCGCCAATRCSGERAERKENRVLVARTGQLVLTSVAGSVHRPDWPKRW